MTTIADKTLTTGKPKFHFSDPPQPHLDDSEDRTARLPDVLGTLDALENQAARAGQTLQRIAHSISANATNPKFFYDLGRTLRQRGRWQHAVEHFRRAIQIQPDYVEAYVGLGATLGRQGRLEDAAATLRRALEMRPRDTEAHLELADVLHAQGDLFLATEHLQEALGTDSRRIEAWARLGGILAQRGDTCEALGCYTAALQRETADPDTQYTRGLIALQLGDYAAGWRGFAQRRNARSLAAPEPDWDQPSLRGKSLLVRSEHNVADDLMFASCLPDAIGHVSHCTLQCHPRLVTLFARSFPTATVVPDGPERDAAAADVQVLLGSLPRHFRGSREAFPCRRGYLVPDPIRRRHWQRKLDALGDGLRIGLAWGNAASLEQWKPLLEVPGVQWISLQGGDTGREVAEVRKRSGINIREDFNTFARVDVDDQAALISTLDLVIAAPNHVAHLSGALGANVWTPLPSWPSWRWGLESDSTPWYPSMRLYRQGHAGDWDSEFRQMAADLRQANKRQAAHAEEGSPASSNSTMRSTS